MDRVRMDRKRDLYDACKTLEEVIYCFAAVIIDISVYEEVILLMDLCLEDCSLKFCLEEESLNILELLYCDLFLYFAVFLFVEVVFLLEDLLFESDQEKVIFLFSFYMELGAIIYAMDE